MSLTIYGRRKERGREKGAKEDRILMKKRKVFLVNYFCEKDKVKLL